MRLPGTDRFRPASLRFRATAVATLVVGVALLVGGALLVALVYRSLVGSLDAAGQARARDVAALASSGKLTGTVATTGEESSVVQVLRPDGTVVAASTNIGGDSAMLPASDLQPGVRTLEGLPIGDGGSFRVVVLPAQTPAGPVVVVVASSLAQVQLTTTQVAALLASGTPVLLLVVALVTWRTVGRALRPVETIRRGAAEIGGSDASARLPVPNTGDEIARLAETMNQMLARIEGATARQRQFVGDASHELRTPVAALQADLEVALTHPDNEPPDQVLARLARLTERIRALLESLLFLARSDEGATLPAVRVDLDELVLAEAGRLRAAGATVRVASLDAVAIRGSAEELRRLLANLGDNAASYATAVVSLSVAAHGGTAVLTVADDGPGIPVQDRERVFERFGRLDVSRRRREHGAGAGLGLAICRQIVGRHGGTILIEDGGPGAVVVVRLPALVDAAGQTGAPGLVRGRGRRGAAN